MSSYLACRILWGLTTGGGKPRFLHTSHSCWTLKFNQYCHYFSSQTDFWNREEPPNQGWFPVKAARRKGNLPKRCLNYLPSVCWLVFARFPPCKTCQHICQKWDRSEGRCHTITVQAKLCHLVVQKTWHPNSQRGGATLMLVKRNQRLHWTC